MSFNPDHSEANQQLSFKDKLISRIALVSGLALTAMAGIILFLNNHYLDVPGREPRNWGLACLAPAIIIMLAAGASSRSKRRK